MTSRELRTAQLLVALFEDQIRAHDEHHAKGRAARRADIRSGRYDVTIDARIAGLHEGHAKWTARVAELKAEEEGHAKWTARVVELKAEEENDGHQGDDGGS